MKIFTYYYGTMYQIEEWYWKTIIESIFEANTKRVAWYFNLYLAGSEEGPKKLNHLFKSNNEMLTFYKIPEEELKKFWESVKKTALSYAEYTKTEEKELSDFFWETYENG